MRHATLVLLSVLLCCLFVRPATASPNVLGPVSFDKFTVNRGQVVGSGRITVPGGSTVPFTAPIRVTGEQSDAVCTILSLVLGPLDLDLLGLRVRLEQVDLLITAERSPDNLLGNLLCSAGNDRAQAKALAEGLAAVLSSSNMSLGAVPVDGPTGNFVNTIDYERLSRELTAQQVPVGTDPCPVLHLRIEELNLFLLGLRVQTRAPVVLDITAVPGPGRLLGNLFCQLANLLDEGAPLNQPVARATMSSILREITGGITVGLPGTGVLRSARARPHGTGTTEPCTVLTLVLGPVDLDLLGLVVHLDRVDLVVTAEPGPGNLLGNLLCSRPTNRTAKVRNLRKGMGMLLASPSNTRAQGVSLSRRGLGAAQVEGEVCPILHLEIQELNLFLLGLRVESRAPIVLDVSAHSGPGKVLGNLFCELAGLLDPVE